MDPRLPAADDPLAAERAEARRLLEGLRAGEAEAAARFVAGLPRAAGLAADDVRVRGASWSEAQYVVAREAGHGSWPELERARGRPGDVPAVTCAVEAALAGDEGALAGALAREPGLARGSLHAACALGDEEAALALLAREPEAAREAGGPRGWEPLLYLTRARLGRGDARAAAARVRMAGALLERGADPAASGDAPDTVDGARTALAGAVGTRACPELARALLEAGAPLDAGAVWALAEVAPEEGSAALITLLLEREPPFWMKNGALAPRLAMGDVEGLCLLLAAGAKPDTRGGWGAAGTALHEALLRGCDAALLTVLLESGADPALADRDGRTPYALAVRLGHPAGAALLLEHGASGEEATIFDHALAAALAGAVEEVDAWRSRDPFACQPSRRTDHQLLAWAVGTGRAAAVPVLLELGLDPGIAADDGTLPLHLAVAAGEEGAVRALLAAGASPAARDHRGRAALEHAVGLADPGTRRRLARALLDAGADARAVRVLPAEDAELEAELRAAGAVERPDLPALFELAADAVVSGDLPTLEGLLADEPELARERSPRPHAATLLHYVGANGVEPERQRTPSNAVEVARTLLAAGAEVDAVCGTYGGGPANTTLGLLVSSDHPERAGRMAELVRTLCDAGAAPDGLDDDGAPLATAIAFRKPDAVRELALRARLDNAVFAAAAGRADLVAREVVEGGRLREGGSYCRVPWLGMPADPVGAARAALVRAAQFGHLDVVRLLVERGVDPDAAVNGEAGALHEAAYLGHGDVVEFLLDRGADPGRREATHDGSALGWALEGGHEGVVRSILARFEPDLWDALELGIVPRVAALLDADPGLLEAPEGRGAPLRIAAALGHVELVRLLLGRGASSHVRVQGRSALDHAREGGHAEVVRLLEEAGA